MTVYATVNVGAFNADVFRPGTSIAPPFSRTKQTDDRRACGNGKMRWSGVAADINSRPFRKRIKSFQRKTDRPRLARFRRLPHHIGERFLAWPVRHQGGKSVTGPQRVRKFTKPIGAPQLSWPAAAGIENSVVPTGSIRRLIRRFLIPRRDSDRKRKRVRLERHGYSECTLDERQSFADYVNLFRNRYSF